MVELWLPGEDGTERYVLATSLNLSEHGVGLYCDEEVDRGWQIAIAIHEPEVSFHGRAVVRHCTETPDGRFLAGLEFLFD